MINENESCSDTWARNVQEVGNDMIHNSVIDQILLQPRWLQYKNVVAT